MVKHRPIANYIIPIAMPIIIFLGGIMYSELKDISIRIRQMELYITRIGAKLNIEPLSSIDLNSHSMQPAVVGCVKTPWEDSQ